METIKERNLKLEVVKIKKDVLLQGNRYTGKLLTGAILDKEEIDPFITDVLQNENFKNFEQVREDIE